jgi:hypothetical protein
MTQFKFEYGLYTSRELTMPVASRRRAGLEQIRMLWPQSREMKPSCLGGPELDPVFYEARNKTVSRSRACDATQWRQLSVSLCCVTTRGSRCHVDSSSWLCMSSRNFIVLFYLWYFVLTAHSFLLLLSRPISKTHRNENKCISFSGNSGPNYQVLCVSIVLCNECVGERNSSSFIPATSASFEIRCS